MDRNPHRDMNLASEEFGQDNITEQFFHNAAYGVLGSSERAFASQPNEQNSISSNEVIELLETFAKSDGGNQKGRRPLPIGAADVAPAPVHGPEAIEPIEMGPLATGETPVHPPNDGDSEVPRTRLGTAKMPMIGGLDEIPVEPRNGMPVEFLGEKLPVEVIQFFEDELSPKNKAQILTALKGTSKELATYLAVLHSTRSLATTSNPQTLERTLTALIKLRDRNQREAAIIVNGLTTALGGEDNLQKALVNLSKNGAGKIDALKELQNALTVMSKDSFLEREVAGIRAKVVMQTLGENDSKDREARNLLETAAKGGDGNAEQALQFIDAKKLARAISEPEKFAMALKEFTRNARTNDAVRAMLSATLLAELSPDNRSKWTRLNSDSADHPIPFPSIARLSTEQRHQLYVEALKAIAEFANTPAGLTRRECSALSGFLASQADVNRIDSDVAMAASKILRSLVERQIDPGDPDNASKSREAARQTEQTLSGVYEAMFALTGWGSAGKRRLAMLYHDVASSEHNVGLAESKTRFAIGKTFSRQIEEMVKLIGTGEERAISALVFVIGGDGRKNHLASGTLVKDNLALPARTANRLVDAAEHNPSLRNIVLNVLCDKLQNSVTDHGLRLATLGRISARNDGPIEPRVRTLLHNGLHGEGQMQISALKGLIALSHRWLRADVDQLVSTLSADTMRELSESKNTLPRHAAEYICNALAALAADQRAPYEKRVIALTGLQALGPMFAGPAVASSLQQLGGAESKGAIENTESEHGKEKASLRAERLQTIAGETLLTLAEQCSRDEMKVASLKSLSRHFWPHLNETPPFKDRLKNLATENPNSPAIQEISAKLTYEMTYLKVKTATDLAEIGVGLRARGVQLEDDLLRQSLELAIRNHNQKRVQSVFDRMSRFNGLPSEIKGKISAAADNLQEGERLSLDNKTIDQKLFNLLPTILRKQLTGSADFLESGKILTREQLKGKFIDAMTFNSLDPDLRKILSGSEKPLRESRSFALGQRTIQAETFNQLPVEIRKVITGGDHKLQESESLNLSGRTITASVFNQLPLELRIRLGGSIPDSAKRWQLDDLQAQEFVSDWQRGKRTEATIAIFQTLLTDPAEILSAAKNPYLFPGPERSPISPDILNQPGQKYLLKPYDVLLPKNVAGLKIFAAEFNRLAPQIRMALSGSSERMNEEPPLPNLNDRILTAATFNKLTSEQKRALTGTDEKLAPDQRFSIVRCQIDERLYRLLPTDVQAKIADDAPAPGKFLDDSKLKITELDAATFNGLSPYLRRQLAGTASTLADGAQLKMAGRTIDAATFNRLPDKARLELTDSLNDLPQGYLLRDLSSVHIEAKLFNKLPHELKLKLTGTERRIDAAVLLGQMASNCLDCAENPHRFLLDQAADRQIERERLETERDSKEAEGTLRALQAARNVVLQNMHIRSDEGVGLRGKATSALVEAPLNSKSMLDPPFLRMLSSLLENPETGKLLANTFPEIIDTKLWKVVREGVSKSSTAGSDIAGRSEFLEKLQDRLSDRLEDLLGNPQKKFAARQFADLFNLEKLEVAIKQQKQAINDLKTKQDIFKVADQNALFVQLKAAGKIRAADELALSLLSIYGRAALIFAPDVASALRVPAGTPDSISGRLHAAGLTAGDSLKLNRKIGAADGSGITSGLELLKSLPSIERVAGRSAIDSPVTRMEAFAGVDHDPHLKKMRSIADEIGEKFLVLKAQIDTGMRGDKYEAFIEDTQKRAKELQQILQKITESDLNNLRDRGGQIRLALLEGNEEKNGGIGDTHSRKGLEERLMNIENIIKILDANYKHSPEVLKEKHSLEERRKALHEEQHRATFPVAFGNKESHWRFLDQEIKQINGKLAEINQLTVRPQFDKLLIDIQKPEFKNPSTFREWLRRDFPVLVAAVGGAILATALSPTGMSPLAVAGLATLAGMTLAEGTKEVQRGIGIRSDGTTVGSWLRDEKLLTLDGTYRSADFLSDVAFPYYQEFMVGTTVGFVASSVGSRIALSFNTGFEKLSTSAKAMFRTEHQATLSEVSKRIARLEAMGLTDPVKARLVDRILGETRNQLTFVLTRHGGEELVGHKLSTKLGGSVKELDMATCFLLDVLTSTAHTGIHLRVMSRQSKALEGFRERPSMKEPHLRMAYEAGTLGEERSFIRMREQAGSRIEYTDTGWIEHTARGMRIELVRELVVRTKEARRYVESTLTKNNPWREALERHNSLRWAMSASTIEKDAELRLVNSETSFRRALPKRWWRDNPEDNGSIDDRLRGRVSDRQQPALPSDTTAGARQRSLGPKIPSKGLVGDEGASVGAVGKSSAHSGGYALDWIPPELEPLADALVRKSLAERELRHLDQLSWSPETLNGIDETRKQLRQIINQGNFELSECLYRGDANSFEAPRVVREVELLSAVGDPGLITSITLNLRVRELTQQLSKLESTDSAVSGSTTGKSIEQTKKELKSQLTEAQAKLASITDQVKNPETRAKMTNILELLTEKAGPLIEAQNNLATLESKRFNTERINEATTKVQEALHQLYKDKDVNTLRFSYGILRDSLSSGEYYFKGPNGDRVKVIVPAGTTVPADMIESILQRVHENDQKPDILILDARSNYFHGTHYKGIITLRVRGDDVHYLATYDHESGHLFEMRLDHELPAYKKFVELWENSVRNRAAILRNLVFHFEYNSRGSNRLLKFGELSNNEFAEKIIALNNEPYRIGRQTQYLASSRELMAEMFGVYKALQRMRAEGRDLTYQQAIDTFVKPRDADRAEVMQLFANIYNHLESTLFRDMSIQQATRERYFSLATRDISKNRKALMSALTDHGEESEQFRGERKRIECEDKQIAKIALADTLFAIRHKIDPRLFNPTELTSELKVEHSKYRNFAIETKPGEIESGSLKTDCDLFTANVVSVESLSKKRTATVAKEVVRTLER